jgi:Holliday junction resolvase RusA-like endonuclease
MIKLEIPPIPAPRLNRGSQYNPQKKKLVARYMKWKEDVQLLAYQAGWKPTDELHVIFVLPMPKSWSRQKRERMRGEPHQQKPDRNNLMKALEDALYKDDSGVWKSSEEKIWGESGHIVIL